MTCHLITIIDKTETEITRISILIISFEGFWYLLDNIKLSLRFDIIKIIYHFQILSFKYSFPIKQWLYIHSQSIHILNNISLHNLKPLGRMCTKRVFHTSRLAPQVWTMKVKDLDLLPLFNLTCTFSKTSQYYTFQTLFSTAMMNSFSPVFKVQSRIVWCELIRDKRQVNLSFLIQLLVKWLEKLSYTTWKVTPCKRYCRLMSEARHTWVG